MTLPWFKRVLTKLLPLGSNVAFTFFVTLAVFPAVTSLVNSSGADPLCWFPILMVVSAIIYFNFFQFYSHMPHILEPGFFRLIYLVILFQNWFPVLMVLSASIYAYLCTHK
jgi:hypothetical protein